MFSRVLALCAVLGMVGILAAKEAVDYGPLPPPQLPEIEAIFEPSNVIQDAEVRPAASVESESSTSDKHAQLEQKLREAAELQSEISTLRNEIARQRTNSCACRNGRGLAHSFAKTRCRFRCHWARSDRIQRLDQLRQAFKARPLTLTPKNRVRSLRTARARSWNGSRKTTLPSA